MGGLLVGFRCLVVWGVCGVLVRGLNLVSARTWVGECADLMMGWACCGCCPNLERFGSHLDVDVGGSAVGAGLVGEDGDDVASADASAHVDVDAWGLEVGA